MCYNNYGDFMKIMKIVKDTEKSLRKPSVEVPEPFSKEDIDLALYLHNHLVFAEDEENQKKYGLRAGVGLAAPQVGVNKRIIAVYINYNGHENKEEDYKTEYALINPKIVAHSVRNAYLLGGEGCLSVENEHLGYVPRFANITVTGYDCLTKQYINIKFRGYEAIVFQHEIDHLDGILFYDHINKENPFQKIDKALEI